MFDRDRSATGTTERRRAGGVIVLAALAGVSVGTYVGLDYVFAGAETPAGCSVPAGDVCPEPGEGEPEPTQPGKGEETTTTVEETTTTTTTTPQTTESTVPVTSTTTTTTAPAPTTAPPAPTTGPGPIAPTLPVAPPAVAVPVQPQETP